MKLLEKIEGFDAQMGGEPHSGWLPPGAAVPAPTPIRHVTLDLSIESDGDGFVLIFHSRDGSVRGDTWHDSLADAHEQAQNWFGVAPEQWKRCA